MLIYCLILGLLLSSKELRGRALGGGGLFKFLFLYFITRREVLWTNGLYFAPNASVTSPRWKDCHRILSGGNTGLRKRCCRRSWPMWGSNSRPWRYQHHALPTELIHVAQTSQWWKGKGLVFEVGEGRGGKSTELFSKLGQVMLHDPLGGVGICHVNMDFLHCNALRHKMTKRCSIGKYWPNSRGDA